MPPQEAAARRSAPARRTARWIEGARGRQPGLHGPGPGPEPHRLRGQQLIVDADHLDRHVRPAARGSYAIPTDDPSYARLLNWSWTYDSAVTAAGFTVFGATSEAQQLLDQLAALQHTDGSIEIAFNVTDGTTESVFRSGTIATVGLAGSLYDQRTRSNRYLAMEQRAATYLISLQGTNGLVRGGPDVAWYSTQHNLLAYAFLNNLGNELV